MLHVNTHPVGGNGKRRMYLMICLRWLSPCGVHFWRIQLLAASGRYRLPTDFSLTSVLAVCQRYKGGVWKTEEKEADLLWKAFGSEARNAKQ